MNGRFLWSSAAVAWMVMSCNAIFGLDEPKPFPNASTGSSQGGANTGGSSGSGAAGGGAGGGGSGGAVPCEVASECPGEDTECGTRTCEGGLCGSKNVAPFGFTIAAQIPGDCRKKICDGDGNVGETDDDTDGKDDNNRCTQDLCVGGRPENPNEDEGTPCGVGLECDGDGHCKGCDSKDDCEDDTTCLTWECNAGTCESDRASNGIACGKCKTCQAGNCVNVPASQDPHDDCLTSDTCNGGGECFCSDGVQNNGESDIDCGAVCSDKCTPGQTCFSEDDCTPSFYCSFGVCCDTPCVSKCRSCTENTSNDGVCAAVQPGADPHDDCGGADSCDGMQGCHCGNGVQDVGETGIDCGGPCAPCGGTWQCDNNCIGAGSMAGPSCCSATNCLSCPFPDPVGCLALQGQGCTASSTKQSFPAEDGISSISCDPDLACSLWTCECTP